MIRKSFIFAMISLWLSAAAFGQQQQQTGETVERRIGRIIMSESFVGGYLGVQTQEVTKENFARYNLREARGVAVETVAKDSPAAQAGIQAGDVIVRFGGEEVSSVYKLTRLLNETAPDHSAKITVVRGGGEIELTATLGKRPTTQFQAGGFNADDFHFPGVPEFPRAPMPPNGTMTMPIPPVGADGNAFIFRGGAARQIGINATPLTKQLGDYFGVGSGEGLLINTVRENSPAAKAGIKAGDVITETDGKAVKNTADLIRALSDKKEGDVTLTIVRDKNRQTVRVMPEASKDAPFQYFGDSSEGSQRQLRLLRQLKPQAPIQK